jgi:hypothetical protein
MNKKINQILLILFIPILTLQLFGCNCECICSKDIGCKTLSIKLHSNDSLITRKFCSNTHYYTDKSLEDSVTTFLSSYASSTLVISKDSILQKDQIPNLECDEIDKYEKSGYSCSCFK